MITRLQLFAIKVFVIYTAFCKSTEKLGTEELGKEKEITQNNNRRDEYMN